jgi:hypothetical protein
MSGLSGVAVHCFSKSRPALILLRCLTLRHYLAPAQALSKGGRDRVAGYLTGVQ